MTNETQTDLSFASETDKNRRTSRTDTSTDAAAAECPSNHVTDDNMNSSCDSEEDDLAESEYGDSSDNEAHLGVYRGWDAGAIAAATTGAAAAAGASFACRSTQPPGSDGATASSVHVHPAAWMIAAFVSTSYLALQGEQPGTPGVDMGSLPLASSAQRNPVLIPPYTPSADTMATDESEPSTFAVEVDDVEVDSE